MKVILPHLRSSITVCKSFLFNLETFPLFGPINNIILAMSLFQNLFLFSILQLLTRAILVNVKYPYYARRPQEC